MFLSCPEFDIRPIFLSGIFLFCFLVCFSTKIGPKIPAKIPRNRPFSPRICLFKSREISLFFPRIIRSPGLVCTLAACRSSQDERTMSFELHLKTRLYSAVKSPARNQTRFNSPQRSQHAPQRQGPNQG